MVFRIMTRQSNEMWGMEERLKRKRNKILHTRTGSGLMRFEFSNSYIWFEFYKTPLEKDISLLWDTIRWWHIVGRLGWMQFYEYASNFTPQDLGAEHFRS